MSQTIASKPAGQKSPEPDVDGNTKDMGMAQEFNPGAHSDRGPLIAWQLDGQQMVIDRSRQGIGISDIFNVDLPVGQGIDVVALEEADAFKASPGADGFGQSLAL